METIVKDVADLSKEEFAKCDCLNLRSRGMMQSQLHSCWSYKSGIAVMLMDVELLAWALIFQYNGPEMGVYYYTRETQRKKGYGSVLAKHVAEIVEKPRAWPWDVASEAFFTKQNYILDFRYYLGRNSERI